VRSDGQLSGLQVIHSGLIPWPRRQRQDQSHRPLGEMPAAMRGIDVVSDVAVVKLQVLGVADPQRDAAGDGQLRPLVIAHPPVIGGKPVHRGVPRLPPVGAGREKIEQLGARDFGQVRRFALGSRMLGRCQGGLKPIAGGRD
jgi:hypothetical protein